MSQHDTSMAGPSTEWTKKPAVCIQQQPTGAQCTQHLDCDLDGQLHLAHVHGPELALYPDVVR